MTDTQWLLDWLWTDFVRRGYPVGFLHRPARQVGFMTLLRWVLRG